MPFPSFPDFARKPFSLNAAAFLNSPLATEAEARVVPRYEKELGIVMTRVRMREGRVIAA